MVQIPDSQNTPLNRCGAARGHTSYHETCKGNIKIHKNGKKYLFHIGTSLQTKLPMNGFLKLRRGSFGFQARSQWLWFRCGRGRIWGLVTWAILFRAPRPAVKAPFASIAAVGAYRRKQKDSLLEQAFSAGTSELGCATKWAAPALGIQYICKCLLQGHVGHVG
jgi:hypothetical protein